MIDYVDVDDPDGDNATTLQAISGNGAIVAGTYTGGQYPVGFVENLETGVYADVSDPNAVYGSYLNAISADGSTVGGLYFNSGGENIGFVENVETGVYTDVSDPNAVYGTAVSAISSDGEIVAGTYNNSSDEAIGFVENLETGVYTDVSDPNAATGEFGGTVVDAISANGEFVAGDYTNSSDEAIGFVENVGTGVYADVSDPNANAADGTSVVGVSDDGVLAGYYINNSGDEVGFVENAGTGVYTDVSDPNADGDTTVTAISADGTTVGGYYYDSAGENIGFVENVGTGVYTDVSDPNAATPNGVVGAGGTHVGALSANGATVAGFYINNNDFNDGFVENVGTGVYTDANDPDAVNGSIVNVISADGTTIAGDGFVENLETGAYTDVSDPNAAHGTYVDAISEDDGIVAGYYVDSSDENIGFVENLGTGAYTDVSDPSGVEGTRVTAISADGETVAGFYVTSSDDDVGFVENLGTGAFTDVSDPNAANPTRLGGTFVEGISANGATVAGYYVDSSGDDVGFVEDVGTGVYTDVSDPNGSDTSVAAISADGGTVAGTYYDSSGEMIGFVEDLATRTYTDVSDPNASAPNGQVGSGGTDVTSVSANGAVVAGYYIDSSGEDIGFVENVGTGVYTDVADPNATDETFVNAISGDGATVAGAYFNDSDSNFEFIGFSANVPCYGRGTRILTERGEAAVEALAIGDVVLTAAGEKRAVKWLGHRAVDCLRHPDPPSVWPIRVSAGAFGENRPRRDLWLSPGHNVAVEGALMPIGALQNGRSIVQIERATVEYWHVELHQHDIILAEGLPAESYLDTGNRTAFANGGAFIDAHPDFRPKHWAQTCAPLVLEGPKIARAKASLLQRLETLGHTTTAEADLHLMADGERIEPLELGAMRFAFAIPPDRSEIRLTSRTFVPAHTLAESADPRSLGVCVGRLQIDGEDIALDDAAHFRAGWHGLEPGHRWTRGSAPLPANTRLVLIDLAGPGRYWRESRKTTCAPGFRPAQSGAAAWGALGSGWAAMRGQAAEGASFNPAASGSNR